MQEIWKFRKQSEIWNGQSLIVMLITNRNMLAWKEYCLILSKKAHHFHVTYFKLEMYSI